MGKNKRIKPLLFIGAAVGVIALIYFAGVCFFSSRFAANTSINGIPCGFKSVDDVEALIEESVARYSIEIVGRHDSADSITGEQVGLEYVPDGQIERLLDEQNEFAWPSYFFAGGFDKEISTALRLDSVRFAEAFAQLSCTDAATMTEPIPAYPELCGGLYIVHPADPGTMLSYDRAAKTIIDGMMEMSNRVDLDERGCYEDADVPTEDSAVRAEVERRNRYLSLTVTYHIADEKVILDGSITDGWFSWDDGTDAPTPDRTEIEAWVDSLCAKYNTVGTTRRFTSADGSKVTVSGGTYGWEIDRDAEIKMLLSMYKDWKKQDREPVWRSKGASTQERDFGGTYIEISLTKQHLWYMKDEECIFESDVVTGLPTAGRETPEGVYSVLERARNKVLRGPKKHGVYAYETPVSYWMRVTWKGVGMHDAKWQPQFGGDRYTYGGSHGCINMPFDKAAELYEQTWVGLPVVIHY